MRRLACASPDASCDLSYLRELPKSGLRTHRHMCCTRRNKPLGRGCHDRQKEPLTSPRSPSQMKLPYDNQCLGYSQSTVQAGDCASTPICSKNVFSNSVSFFSKRVPRSSCMAICTRGRNDRPSEGDSSIRRWSPRPYDNVNLGEQ